MDVRLAAFASELTKVAAKRERKRQGYASQVAAAAPFAAATSLGDVPRGWVDKYVDNSVRGIAKAKRESPWGRAIGRGAGRFGASLITSPVFLSGIRDLQSGEKERKKRGYAKVIGSGIAYSALKGGGEAAIENWKKNPAAILKKVKAVAGARSIVGAGAAALTAGAVAKATSKPKKGKKSFFDSYIVPAAVGGLTGAAKGGFEEAWELGQKATMRGIAAKASGRMAAGGAAAVIMAEAVKRLMPSKKNPKVKRWQKVKTAEAAPSVAPTSGAIYDQVRGWSKGKNDADIMTFYKEITAEGIGERTPSRRAATYALHDELSHRGHEMPGLTMREQVAEKRIPVPGVGSAAALLAVASTPALAFAAASQIEPDDRDRVFSDALDRMYIHKKMERVDVPHGGQFYAHGVPDEALEGLGLTSEQRARVRGKKSSRIIGLAPRGKELSGIVAHELGHSTAGALRQGLGTPLAQKASVAGAVASVVIPLVAIDGAGDGSFATPEELRSRARFLEAVGVVAGAAQAPVLAEETIANVKGYGLLRSVGAKPGEALSRMLRHAGPGYLTYLAPATIPFLAAAHLRRKSRTKTAAVGKLVQKGKEAIPALARAALGRKPALVRPGQGVVGVQGGRVVGKPAVEAFQAEMGQIQRAAPSAPPARPSLSPVSGAQHDPRSWVPIGKRESQQITGHVQDFMQQRGIPLDTPWQMGSGGTLAAMGEPLRKDKLMRQLASGGKVDITDLDIIFGKDFKAKAPLTSAPGQGRPIGIDAYRREKGWIDPRITEASLQNPMYVQNLNVARPEHMLDFKGTSYFTPATRSESKRMWDTHDEGAFRAYLAQPKRMRKHGSAGYRKSRGVLLDKDIPIIRNLPDGGGEAAELLRKRLETVKKTTWSHAQVAVPVEHAGDLRRLGFKSDPFFAIPLPGEKWFSKTWRKGKLHAHKRGPFYVVHMDRNPGYPRSLKDLRHMIEDVPPALVLRLKGAAKHPVLFKESR